MNTRRVFTPALKKTQAPSENHLKSKMTRKPETCRWPWHRCTTASKSKNSGLPSKRPLPKVIQHYAPGNLKASTSVSWAHG
jgi:hypothetical protein